MGKGNRKVAVSSGPIPLSPLSRMERGNVADLDHYKVRLNDTLASISITNMNISRNATSPLTAVKSAPLKRICLIALTEWVSGLMRAKLRSHGGKLSTG